MQIRPAGTDDAASINAVYNHYVAHSHATFDIEERTLDERLEWMRHYATFGRHRLLVAVEGKSVLGFATSSPFKDRRAYETSVETSVYLAPHACGRGLGRKLYDALFTALNGEDLHRAYAGIALPNDASVALHESCGFRQVAQYTEVGRKFDRYWDVAWFEKSLG